MSKYVKKRKEVQKNFFYTKNTYYLINDTNKNKKLLKKLKALKKVINDNDF